MVDYYFKDDWFLFKKKFKCTKQILLCHYVYLFFILWNKLTMYVHTSLHLKIKFLLCLTKLFSRNKTKIIYPNIKQAFNFHLKIFNHFFLTFFAFCLDDKLKRIDVCRVLHFFPYFQFSPIARKTILVESKTTNFEIIIMKCSDYVVWVFFEIIAWIKVGKIAFLSANISLKYLIVRVIKADIKLCLGKNYQKQ